ncbi:scavenger receptor class B member 1-like [Saccoglossus kowalevskii]|uniref:Scavenger receptor class B member 1 n=1 Tax=Saccoglossus kowalevskii TaxID=10224 RepID=A0ABM0GRS2_SACKO|nr:PREDICTED: scavenger receptor class B member 1-like [Saccoglossus kowalevskii]
MSKRCCKACVIGFAVLLFIGAAVLPLAMERLEHIQIYELMSLDPDSSFYPFWRDIPIPFYQQYYFFNVLNKEEILKGEKPCVEQIGPYTYRQYINRSDISLNANGTVSYRLKQTYVFQRKLSVGDEDDMFTTLNIPLMVLADMVESKPWIVREIMEEMLKIEKEELFVRLSVRQLILGYPEPLFKILQKIVGKKIIPSNHFGFLLDRNGTDTGLFTVNSGKNNKWMLNKIDRWNGISKLNYWNSEMANTINGTDGSMFHPYICKREVLNVFIPDMCRSIPYLYQEETSYMDVKLWRFSLAQYTYANGTDYAPNQGFCTRGCLPSGLLDIGACRGGARMSLSNPHFFEGDPELAAAIVGLSPNQDNHQNYMDIERIMGLPWRVEARVQLNVFARQVKMIKQTGNIRTVHFPVLWFEQKILITDAVVDIYKNKLVISTLIASIIQYVFIVLGCIFSVSVIILAVKKWRCRKSVTVQSNSTVSTEKQPLLCNAPVN